MHWSWTFGVVLRIQIAKIVSTFFTHGSFAYPHLQAYWDSDEAWIYRYMRRMQRSLVHGLITHILGRGFSSPQLRIVQLTM